jgi:hypothetical protein
VPLPSFQALWKNYPGKQTADEVKKLIGGAVNATWITNTCAIRMSHAFNLSGAPIPGTVSYLNTVKGGNGYRYAYRVAELKKYLEAKYGAPTFRIAGPQTGSREEPAPGKFVGRQGIVVFTDCGWSDASGHFDLWNKDTIGHEAYWGLAKQLSLWAGDGIWTVQGSSTLRQGSTPIVTVGR